MLSSPIILFDYPQIAPESPGTLFDGTETDEILTLRIMTPTDWYIQGAMLVMHELAIAQSIVDVVEAKATECNATHVKGVRLKIGEASGVVADSLTFSFDMLASFNPVLVGAQLLIDVAPHRAICHHCAKEFTIKNFVAQCPTCAEWSNEVISGTELQILEMEIDGPIETGQS